MNVNHNYLKGKGHTTCQDYAMSSLVGGDSLNAFAIVADGCSSSPDSDFGARALTLSAVRTLSIGGINMAADLFGKITIDNLKNLGDNLPLHPFALDATLLVSWVSGENFGVNIYGDGVFFHRSATMLRMVKVEFEENAPSYLSYYLDKVRLKDYTAAIKTGKTVTDVSIYIPGGGKAEDNVRMVQTKYKLFEPVVIRGLVHENEIIGVMTDGVNSFKHNNSSNIGWMDVVSECIDFKTTPGVFVERRLGFLTRRWAKEQINHFDDLSLAAIVV